MILTKPHQSSISGLYAVTPNETDTKKLCAMVKAALQGGVRMVQYRNKVVGQSLRLRQATALLALCRTHGVPLVINDHLDLCAQIDADGLHLGAADCHLVAARRLLGANKLIGVSCYNQFDLAEKAQADGASYVAFGACFTSATKPNAVHAPLCLFEQAKQQLQVPIVAIGGITLANIKQVQQAGADMVAVVGAVFGAENIAETCQQFNSTF